MPRPSQIGVLLRDAGVAKGRSRAPNTMSVRALEQKTGVTRAAIGRWMADLGDGERRRVDWAALYQVTDALGIPRHTAELARASDAGYPVPHPSTVADLTSIAAELLAAAASAPTDLATTLARLATRLSLATQHLLDPHR